MNLARDRAVADGIIINGLPIINDRLDKYGWRSRLQRHEQTVQVPIQPLDRIAQAHFTGPHLMSGLSRRLLHRGEQKSAAALPKFHVHDMPCTGDGA